MWFFLIENLIVPHFNWNWFLHIRIKYMKQHYIKINSVILFTFNGHVINNRHITNTIFYKLLSLQLDANSIPRETEDWQDFSLI